MLADGLGLKAEPSLYLVLCPDQLCPNQLPGTNFAVAGARSVKLPDGFPIDLPVQVDVFLASRGFSAPSDALYVVFIGGNDVRDARDTAGEEMAQEIISNAVDEIDSTIRTLAWAGAKNFVLANVPDIGSLPESGPVGGMTAKRASKLTRMFNGSLAQAVEYIEDDFDIEILEFNTFRFLRSVNQRLNQRGLPSNLWRKMK